MRKKKVNPSTLVGEDRKSKKAVETAKDTDRKYKALLDYVEEVEEKADAAERLAEPSIVHTIKPERQKGGGESTCVVVASDWHIEEVVSPEAVNGSPAYNFNVAKKRADEFFQTALYLRNLEARNSLVPNMVLALLGDFITGNLYVQHGSGKNTCMEPVEAAFEAKNLIKSGIDFLLKESDLKLLVPCHAGNHSRITAKTNDSETEMGNSLEFMVYGFLKQEYANEPRVKFKISKSYTSLVNIYDLAVRFHHGHRIKYGGGIGGLAVPASKYVLRKNTHFHADLDVFGHHHQKQKGPRFICNGSMIGYTAYGADGAFEYEVPSQTYFLVNKRWKEVIDYRPILFSV